MKQNRLTDTEKSVDVCLTLFCCFCLQTAAGAGPWRAVEQWQENKTCARRAERRARDRAKERAVNVWNETERGSDKEEEKEREEYERVCLLVRLSWSERSNVVSLKAAQALVKEAKDRFRSDVGSCCANTDERRAKWKLGQTKRMRSKIRAKQDKTTIERERSDRFSICRTRKINENVCFENGWKNITNNKGKTRKKNKNKKQKGKQKEGDRRNK